MQIPARLQINQEYIHINEWWDRTEKGLYLFVECVRSAISLGRREDANVRVLHSLCLNILFIRTVNERLIAQGLERYRPLLNFNSRYVAPLGL